MAVAHDDIRRVARKVHIDCRTTAIIIVVGLQIAFVSVKQAAVDNAVAFSVERECTAACILRLRLRSLVGTEDAVLNVRAPVPSPQPDGAPRIDDGIPLKERIPRNHLSCCRDGSALFPRRLVSDKRGSVKRNVLALNPRTSSAREVRFKKAVRDNARFRRIKPAAILRRIRKETALVEQGPVTDICAAANRRLARKEDIPREVYRPTSPRQKETAAGGLGVSQGNAIREGAVHSTEPPIRATVEALNAAARGFRVHARNRTARLEHRIADEGHRGENAAAANFRPRNRPIRRKAILKNAVFDNSILDEKSAAGHLIILTVRILIVNETVADRKALHPRRERGVRRLRLTAGNRALRCQVETARLPLPVKDDILRAPRFAAQGDCRGSLVANCVIEQVDARSDHNLVPFVCRVHRRGQRRRIARCHTDDLCRHLHRRQENCRAQAQKTRQFHFLCRTHYRFFFELFSLLSPIPSRKRRHAP